MLQIAEDLSEDRNSSNSRVSYARRGNNATPDPMFRTFMDQSPSKKANTEKNDFIRSTQTREAPKQLSSLIRGGSVPSRGTEHNLAQSPNDKRKNLPPVASRSRGTLDDISRFNTGRGSVDNEVVFNEPRRGVSSEKKLNIERDVLHRKVLVDDDYEALGLNINRDEDKEHVKTLDRWRLEIKRKKILNSMDKMTEIMDMYRQKKTKDNTNTNFPTVNSEALNRILVESDDNNEEDDDNTDKNKSARGRGSRQTSLLNQDGEKFYKGVEATITESNQELITSLIMKKVKEQFKNIDLKKVDTQQLKLQVKLIAESVVVKFKALKGHASETTILNQVDLVLKKIKAKKGKKDASDAISKDSQDAPKDEKTVMDYQMIETTLLKNYEQSFDEAQTLASRLTHLTHEIFQVKKEISQHQEQLYRLNKKGLGQSTRIETISTPTSILDSPIKVTSILRDRSPGSREFDNSNAAAIEHVKAQKARQEKKKQESALSDKIVELQQKLANTQRENESVDAALKVARTSKGYFKLQLRDLYYKILKDENNLLQNKNGTSCTWIVKALWQISEEVKEKAFPTFLDRKTIQFMLDYSQTQAEIEKYCRSYALMGMLNNMDDFRRPMIITESQTQATLQTRERDDLDNEDLLPREGMLQIVNQKPKAMTALLEDYKERMLSMKKVNLKAKRLVNVIQFSNKGRNIVTKWEDVNPMLSSSELFDQYKKVQYEGEDSPPSISDKTKQSPVDLDPIPGMPAGGIAGIPTDTVNAMLANLEDMKKSEIARIIKENIGISFDERQSSLIQKTLLFLFGKSDGSEAFRRFLKEKKNFDDKNMRSNQTHKKSQSYNSYNPTMLSIAIIKQQVEAEQNMIAEQNYQPEPQSEMLTRRTTLQKLPTIKRSATLLNSPLTSSFVRSTNHSPTLMSQGTLRTQNSMTESPILLRKMTIKN